MTAPPPARRRISHAKHLQMVRLAMHERFLQMRERAGARTVEEFYGFRAEDGAETYNAKIGFGTGTWWRLTDGRVFDITGCLSQPEPWWYEPPTYSLHEDPSAPATPQPRRKIDNAELRELIRKTMRDRFVQVRGLTRAKTPEDYYGFRAEDVVEVHRRKQGASFGVWWRLKDGRVFDCAGRPSEPERHWYEYTEH